MLLNRKGRRKSAMAELANMSKSFYKNYANSTETSTITHTQSRPLSTLISHFNNKHSESNIGVHMNSPTQKSVKTFFNEKKETRHKAQNLSEAFSQLVLSRKAKFDVETCMSNKSNPIGTRRVSQLFDNLQSMKHEQIPLTTSNSNKNLNDSSKPVLNKFLNQTAFLSSSSACLSKSPVSQDMKPTNSSSPKSRLGHLIFDKQYQQQQSAKSYNSELIFNSFYYDNKPTYSLSLSNEFLDMLDNANDEEFQFLGDEINESFPTLSTINKNVSSNYSLTSTDYFDDSSTTSTDFSTMPLSDMSSFNSQLNSFNLTSHLNSSINKPSIMTDDTNITNNKNNILSDADEDPDRTLNNTSSFINCANSLSATETDLVLKLDQNNNNDNLIDLNSNQIINDKENGYFSILMKIIITQIILCLMRFDTHIIYFLKLFR